MLSNARPVRCRSKRNPRGGLVNLTDPKLPTGQVEGSNLLSGTHTKSILVGGPPGELRLKECGEGLGKDRGLTGAA
eukprot:8674625-Pyramimonas_sp.AAC.1